MAASLTTKLISSTSQGDSTSKSSSTRVILDSSVTGIATARHTNTVSFASTLGVTASTTSQELPAISTSTGLSPTAAPTAIAQVAAAPILNKAQVAGISVAGGIVGFIAVGLVVFLFCIKKRRDRRRDSDASFGLDADIAGVEVGETSSSGGTRPAKSVGQMPHKAQQMLGVPGGPAEKRWTLWRYAMSKSPASIGLAISSEGQKALPHESSPLSIKSYQTTSRLLPDKPVFKNSAPPQPVQFANAWPVPGEHAERPAAGPGLRVISPTPPPPPKSEHRAWKNENTSQLALQNAPLRPQQQLRHQPSDPFIERATDPRATMYTMEGRRASVKDLPRIITPTSHISQPRPTIAGQSSQLQRPQPPPHLASLVPAPLNPAGSHVSPLSAATPLLPSPSIYSGQQQPSTYTLSPPPNPAPARHIGTDNHSDRSQLPSHSSQSFNKYVPLRSSRRGSKKRPETYYTTGSDTSFEDDADEPSELLAAQAPDLSPVAESPASIRTPLSRIKYPAIPSPSAERYLGTSPASRSPVPQAKPYNRSLLSTHRSPSPSHSRKEIPRQGSLPPARALVELPERSSSKRAPPLDGLLGSQNSPGSVDRQGAKWQIICSPGLDGEIEVGGSPTMSGESGKSGKGPISQGPPVTPPEYRTGRKMHGVRKGDWIE
ncbi:MAG: hypothetical protein MMC23_006503 [Stictis urceolatum]|nr:hypothetical protein [Stictis urceolata]